jgi:hypothetical protein
VGLRQPDHRGDRRFIDGRPECRQRLAAGRSDFLGNRLGGRINIVHDNFRTLAR